MRRTGISQYWLDCTPTVALLLCCLFLFPHRAMSQFQEPRPNRPPIEYTVHRINNVRFAIDNAGSFGLTTLKKYERRWDVFTGKEIAVGCEYPASSNLIYTAGFGLHLGAIVGGDTVVSTALDTWDNWSTAIGYHNEMSPDWPPSGDIVRRSTLYPDSAGYEDAVSQEDIIAVYFDTIRVGSWVFRDEVTNRRHMPLWVEITERSYAWSYEYADDFILFDLSIKNIGTETLTEAFVGLYGHAEAGYYDEWHAPQGDDVGGYLRRAVSTLGCMTEDTVNLLWWTDNDGDPVEGRYQDSFRPYRSARHAAGIRFLGWGPIAGGGEPKISFNWWDYYGAPTAFSPMRKDLSGYVGRIPAAHPIGDLDIYAVMSSGEIDYGPQFTKWIKPWDPIWQYPPR